MIKDHLLTSSIDLQEKDQTTPFLIKPYKFASSAKSTVILFSFCGLLFCILGVVVLLENNSIVEVSARYDDICKNNPTCEVKFQINDQMSPPIYLFYQLDNFHQNHRRYLKSKDSDQLEGKTITHQKAEISCSPLVTNEQMGKTKSWNNSDLDPKAVASPCGIMAKSLFTDEYNLFVKENQADVEKKIDDKVVSWPKDQGNKYKQSSDSATTQWIQPDNPHFIVWMRAAGTVQFRKFWGQINDPLIGEVSIKIQNNYPVDTFDGQKHVILSTSGIFGGKNIFIQYCFFALCFICIIIAIIFEYQIRKTEGKFGVFKKND